MGVAKNLSFIKVSHSNHKNVKRAETAKSDQRNNVSKLPRVAMLSPREQLLIKTKQELNEINHTLKAELDAYDNEDFDPSKPKESKFGLPIRSKSETGNQAFQPQVIRKARIFHDKDYMQNI